MSSLLEQAKAIKTNRKDKKFNDEYLELAIAWLTGEISLTQFSVVLKYKSPAGSISRLMQLLKEAYRLELIVKGKYGQTK